MPSSLWADSRNYYNVLLFLGTLSLRGFMVISENHNAVHLMRDVILFIYVYFCE